MNNLINNKSCWQTYSNHTIIDKDETHIFNVSINAYENIAHQYLKVLSAEEIAIAYRFRQINDMKRYIIGKFFLRIILSKMLSIQPSAITFLHTKSKKAYIAEQHFNISHSGDFVVIAISPLAIGIDIEFVNKDFKFRSLLKKCFTQAELLKINDTLSFYTFWTRKEAILKATGEGLIDNLHSIDCSKRIVFRNGSYFKLLSDHIDHKYIISVAINNLCFGYNYWSLKI